MGLSLVDEQTQNPLLRLRVTTDISQKLALRDSFRSIEPQQPCCRPADVGNWLNHQIIQLEMVGPVVRPGIVQPRNLSGA